MNMKQALYFKTIARYGTITAAAKQLYISQPSLSQTLRQIEDEVGTPLFDRSTSPFHLTYAGERYLKAVEAMLEIDARLKAEIESIRHEDGGRLRLGISVTRAMQVLPDVMPIFSREYPNVTLELTETASANLEGLLQKGEVDLALAATEPSEMNITYELIEKESIGILAGKDSAIHGKVPTGTPISLKDLEGESFVSLDISHSARIVQDRLFRRYNFHPHILLETSSLEVGRRVALKSGACIDPAGRLRRQHGFPVRRCLLPPGGLRQPPALLRLLPQRRKRKKIRQRLHPDHLRRPGQELRESEKTRVTVPPGCKKRSRGFSPSPTA